jgi:protein disulfide-isomerase
MKKWLVCALCVSASLFAQSDNQSNGAPSTESGRSSNSKTEAAAGFQWYTDFEEASRVASRQKKPMVLYFTGSDWCGWCKKMDQEVFSSQEFKAAVARKYIFVKLDFPMSSKLPESEMRQNAQLKQRYGVTGYPTIVLIDSEGNFIGETGYRSGGGKSYADWLDTFFAK